MNTPKIPKVEQAPDLDDDIKHELGKMIAKVKKRSATRCKTLEADIVLLIREFLRGYNLAVIRKDVDMPTESPIEDAVEEFCRGLTYQVQKHDVTEFIESFSSKILEVSDAEKTNG